MSDVSIWADVAVAVLGGVIVYNAMQFLQP